MSWKVFTLPSASVATPWNHLKKPLIRNGRKWKQWRQQKMVASTRLYSRHGLLIISPLVGFTREAEWVGDIYQEIYFKELAEQLWGWLGIHRARKGRLELWVGDEAADHSWSFFWEAFVCSWGLSTDWFTHRSPLMSTDYGLESYLQSILTIIASLVLIEWLGV